MQETVTMTIDNASDEKEEQSDSKPKPDNKGSEKETLKSDFEAEKKAYHVKELEK